MAKENYTGVGSFEIIAESNRQLNMLEKELKHFTIQKSDLRFSLYSMIIAMLQNNIRMRLWINELMSNQLEESKRRLDSEPAGHNIFDKKGSFMDLHDEYAAIKPSRNGMTRHHDDGHITEGYHARDANHERDKQRNINRHEKMKSPGSVASLLGSTKALPRKDHTSSHHKRSQREEKKRYDESDMDKESYAFSESRHGSKY